MSFGRHVILIAIFALVSLAVHAQDASGREVELNPSLQLQLTTVTPSICISSPLSLELNVTNISREVVTVDTSKLWSQFSYVFAGFADQARSGALGVGTSRMHEEMTILYPGMTYQSFHEFPLEFEFFHPSGEYRLSTQINSIFSNEVRFELNDCGKSQKIEDKQ